MNNPKISVLIPMYNRRHYIEQCINSVLAQTFRDFEIIVIDDCSTDDSFELVKTKFRDNLEGGVKILRNAQNLGEFLTTNRLFTEATGKYVLVLHSDDLLMPYALESLYDVAENCNADVVHSVARLETSEDNDVFRSDVNFRQYVHDVRPVKQITIISDDPLFRFMEWFEGGTFIDTQYNFFNRKFLIDNEIFFNISGRHSLMCLCWLMFAKVLVKTPIIHYIRRDAADSGTNRRIFSSAEVEKFIALKIELSRHMEEYLPKINFFRENPLFQDIAKANVIIDHDNFFIKRLGVYENGISIDLYQAVKKAFEKYFYKDAFYPALLFHFAHELQFNRPFEKDFLKLAIFKKGGKNA